MKCLMQMWCDDVCDDELICQKRWWAFMPKVMMGFYAKSDDGLYAKSDNGL